MEIQPFSFFSRFQSICRSIVITVLDAPASTMNTDDLKRLRDLPAVVVALVVSFLDLIDVVRLRDATLVVDSHGNVVERGVDWVSVVRNRRFVQRLYQTNPMWNIPRHFPPRDCRRPLLSITNGPGLRSPDGGTDPSSLNRLLVFLKGVFDTYKRFDPTWYVKWTPEVWAVPSGNADGMLARIRAQLSAIDNDISYDDETAWKMFDTAKHDYMSRVARATSGCVSQLYVSGPSRLTSSEYPYLFMPGTSNTWWPKILSVVHRTIDGKRIDWTECTTDFVTLDGCRIENLDGLSSCASVRKLYVHNCDVIPVFNVMPNVAEYHFRDRSQFHTRGIIVVPEATKVTMSGVSGFLNPPEWTHTPEYRQLLKAYIDRSGPEDSPAFVRRPRDGDFIVSLVAPKATTVTIIGSRVLVGDHIKRLTLALGAIVIDGVYPSNLVHIDMVVPDITGLGITHVVRELQRQCRRLKTVVIRDTSCPWNRRGAPGMKVDQSLAYTALFENPCRDWGPAINHVLFVSTVAKRTMCVDWIKGRDDPYFLASCMCDSNPCEQHTPVAHDTLAHLRADKLDVGADGYSATVCIPNPRDCLPRVKPYVYSIKTFEALARVVSMGGISQCYSVYDYPLTVAADDSSNVMWHDNEMAK